VNLSSKTSNFDPAVCLQDFLVKNNYIDFIENKSIITQLENKSFDINLKLGTGFSEHNKNG